MDHINYTYTFDASKENSFEMKFNSVTRPVKSHLEEIKETAKYIANSIDGRIYLFSSGGIDSEIIGNEFLDIGRDFEVITLSLSDNNNNNNKHDIIYANKWCRKHNVKQHIKQINVNHFCENDIPKYVNNGFVGSHSIYRYLQIYMLELAEEMNGHAVLGGREYGLYLNENKEPGTLNGIWYNTGIDYCSKYNKQHYPAFYLQNPEIFASYLKLPLVNYLFEHIEYLANTDGNTSLEKIMEYNRIFPNLEPRQKADGFETIGRKPEIIKNTARLYPKESIKYFIPISKIKSDLGI